MVNDWKLSIPLQRQDRIITLLILILAVLLSLLPIIYIALLLLSVTGLLILLRWPVTGLFGIALTIPVAPVLRITVGPAAVSILDLLLAATFTAWFLRKAAFRTSLRPSRRIWLLAPFLAVLLFSTLAAQSLLQAFPELVKWAEVLLLTFLSLQLLDDRYRTPLVLTLLFAATAESLLGIRQFLLRIGPEAYQLGSFLRAYGTFGQPNPFAGYLGLHLPLGLALSLGLFQEARNKAKGEARLCSIILGAVVAALTLIIALGVLSSWSRGAWLGVAASTVVVLAFASAMSRLLLLSGALAALFTYPFLPVSISQRLGAALSYFGVWDVRQVPITDANFAILERVAHWQAAWAMFADHFWLGIGIGNWDLNYPDYAIPPWFDAMGHAHNVLFHYAAVAGLLGALSFLWLWLGSLVVAIRSALASSGRMRYIAIGGVGLLIHLSVHNQFDNLFVQGMPLVFALTLGLIPLPRR